MPFQNQGIGALFRYEINQTFAHSNQICFGVFFNQNLFTFTGYFCSRFWIKFSTAISPILRRASCLLEPIWRVVNILSKASNGLPTGGSF